MKEFSSSSNLRGGKPYNSIAATAFSKPEPRSSQILYLRKAEASISFLDSGVVRMSRSIFLVGSSLPGFEISIWSSNISTIGPEPRTVKSWWISVLAMSSRSAISGYTTVSLRSAFFMISLPGSNAFTKSMSPSKPIAYPFEPGYSFSVFDLFFPLYLINRMHLRARPSKSFRLCAEANAPKLVM